jgi:hypothetical protein
MSKQIGEQGWPTRGKRGPRCHESGSFSSRHTRLPRFPFHEFSYTFRIEMCSLRQHSTALVTHYESPGPAQPEPG